MPCSGSWRDQEFKAYNFDALGLPPTGGYLHPLLKVVAPITSVHASLLPRCTTLLVVIFCAACTSAMMAGNECVLVQIGVHCIQ